MTYKVKYNSMCGTCTIRNGVCRVKNIPEIDIFKSLDNNKLYTFASDGAECSGMVEVVEENPRFTFTVDQIRQAGKQGEISSIDIEYLIKILKGKNEAKKIIS